MAPSTPERLRVSVVYAQAPLVSGGANAPEQARSIAAPRLWMVTLELPLGATVRDAVAASGLLVHLPGVAIEALDLGVFNRACTPQRQLEQGDRVEIYRSLQIDPKAARHLRVLARRKADARARQLAQAQTDGGLATGTGQSSKA